MLRPARAWIEVDLDALRDNAAGLAAHTGCRLAPVIKADAYGLGAVAVARALEPLEPWGYCIATPAEGRALREAGIARPLLHCPPMLADEAETLQELGVQPAIGSDVAWHAWHRAGGGAWQLAIDTGMARAGVPWQDAARWAERVAGHPPAGVFTHFHSADVADDTMAEQERRFAAAVAALGRRPPLVHSDNSAAAARRPAGGGVGDLVRPGLFLYGVGTGATARIVPQPVVSLRARIVELHTVAAGETVGYGGHYVAPAPRTIATINVGYADGLRRSLGNRQHVLVRGRPVPIVGWVTMDMTMLDVTDTGAQIGDLVTLLGTDDAGRAAGLTLEHHAAAAGCSPYELLVALRLRLPVFHTSQGAAPGGALEREVAAV